MKWTVKKGFYNLAGGKYLKKKVEKNNKILKSGVHESNPKLWKKTLDDNFDIMSVCIHKMRHDKNALDRIHNDINELIKMCS